MVYAYRDGDFHIPEVQAGGGGGGGDRWEGHIPEVQAGGGGGGGG